ncbi:MAG: aspartate ammonia-lyase [Alphaproteobacteria bacterium]|nr:aspartate ammonia-lyase [Alphaproteobacteria bacterium]
MRTESDFLGSMQVPEEALYGIHSLRARNNFPDRTPFHAEWYLALALVKKACYLTARDYFEAVIRKYFEQTAGRTSEQVAEEKNVNSHHGTTAPQHLGTSGQMDEEKNVNSHHGTTAPQHHGTSGQADEWRGGYSLEELLLKKEILNLLIAAASEMAEGRYFEHFIVPAVSGGAGTSINMNINEILANAGLIKAGTEPGNYQRIDPIEDANIFQSTNDVIPTALRVSAMFLLGDLEKAINELRFGIEHHETLHQNDLRIGFTQMQEAVPSSFGKLFSTYSEALSRDWWRVSKCFERIKLVNLGGGAIGTGLSVPRYFIMEVVSNLQTLTALPLARSENLSDATSNLDAFVEVHAILKSHAVNLEKMVSDLRLLASDLVNSHMDNWTSGPVKSSNPHTLLPFNTNHEPRTPERETRNANPETQNPERETRQLELPRVQVGSSIMPGKINPVIPEFVISAAHKIYANDQLIASLCAQGCLELNAYLPVIGHALIESLKLLIACDQTLKTNLFNGLAIHPAISREMLFRSPAVTTALIPLIGYNKAADLAKYMLTQGTDIFSANRELQCIPEARLKQLLLPENLLKLGYTLSDLEKEGEENEKS